MTSQHLLRLSCLREWPLKFTDMPNTGQRGQEDRGGRMPLLLSFEGRAIEDPGPYLKYPLVREEDEEAILLLSSFRRRWRTWRDSINLKLAAILEDTAGLLAWLVKGWIILQDTIWWPKCFEWIYRIVNIGFDWWEIFRSYRCRCVQLESRHPASVYKIPAGLFYARSSRLNNPFRSRCPQCKWLAASGHQLLPVTERC